MTSWFHMFRRGQEWGDSRLLNRCHGSVKGISKVPPLGTVFYSCFGTHLKRDTLTESKTSKVLTIFHFCKARNRNILLKWKLDTIWQHSLASWSNVSFNGMEMYCIHFIYVYIYIWMQYISTPLIYIDIYRSKNLSVFEAGAACWLSTFWPLTNSVIMPHSHARKRLLNPSLLIAHYRLMKPHTVYRGHLPFMVLPPLNRPSPCGKPPGSHFARPLALRTRPQARVGSSGLHNTLPCPKPGKRTFCHLSHLCMLKTCILFNRYVSANERLPASNKAHWTYGHQWCTFESRLLSSWFSFS